VNWLTQLKNRKMIYGTGSVVSVLLVAGILILAALLADWHQVKWDTTRGKSESLTTVSRALLQEVKKPLTMTAFVPEGSPERRTIRDVLQRYAYNNPEVSYHFVDPDRQPMKAQEAGYRFPGNILLEYEGRRQMADQPNENSITNALRKILKAERKQLYFLTGHGERDINDAKPGGFQVAKRALENEGYEVKTLNLLTQSEVPPEAAAIIIASPRKPLLANEVQALKALLNRGGRLLVMLEAFQNGGLQDFLAGYGVVLDDGIILDVNQVSRALGVSAVMPLVAQYGPSKITQDFKNIVTIFPLARPLTLKRDVKDVSLLPLATTMASSYEKMGKEWMKAKQGAFDPKEDRKGPFTLAAQAEIKPAAAKGQAPAGKKAGNDHPTYLVVYGDVDFAANSYFNLFGNGDLFLNSVNFLASEEKQITVREATKAQLLHLSGGQAWILLVASLVWAPLVMLGAGIWAYRRRRASR
jgi:ABC-type uncharacterized transport system involved in gliding motility auxiliary subunit